MDSFNKIISFVLGLVVVLVFFAVVTGKINFKNKTNSASKSTISPTQTEKSNKGFFGFLKPATSPSPTPTKKPTQTQANSNGNNFYNQNNQTVKSSNAKSIPATGLPTLFIPALLFGIMGGSFLRRFSKPGYFQDSRGDKFDDENRS